MILYVDRCNLLCFGVNYDQILLNKKIQKRIFFIQNNDIAAALLLRCSFMLEYEDRKHPLMYVAKQVSFMHKPIHY